MSKTILVTGATGYIGSHVCKHLKQAGYRVVGIDRVYREHTFKHMDRFIHDEFAGYECVEFLSTETVAAVVHCAGTSLVGPSMLDPGEYYVNNVAKTADFLEFLRGLPTVPAVIFSSSAAVYGAPDVDIIYENTSWNPLSPYGQSKAMVEIMLADFSRAYNMKTICLRYFNACGADVEHSELGQAPGATHIVARLLESVRDNKEFTLYGGEYNTPDGTCVRDYVHVDDLAQAHVQAIDYLLSGNPSCSINLGSNHGYSNREIIDAVTRLVGPVIVIKGEPRAGDPDRLVAGNALAKEKLGWEPKHSDLDTIINSAWKWYNNPSNLVDTASK
jgi:UDP-glucose 4-epimerase